MQQAFKELYFVDFRKKTQTKPQNSNKLKVAFTGGDLGRPFTHFSVIFSVLKILSVLLVLILGIFGSHI